MMMIIIIIVIVNEHSYGDEIRSGSDGGGI
jgi:hypothetical protein